MYELMHILGSFFDGNSFARMKKHYYVSDVKQKRGQEKKQRSEQEQSKRNGNVVREKSGNVKAGQSMTELKQRNVKSLPFVLVMGVSGVSEEQEPLLVREVLPLLEVVSCLSEMI